MAQRHRGSSIGDYIRHTFHGSGTKDSGLASDLDREGNICVTGLSDATWGSLPNAHYGNGSGDIVILKLGASDDYLWWHTISTAFVTVLQAMVN